jgi:hypothetical protein
MNEQIDVPIRLAFGKPFEPPEHNVTRFSLIESSEQAFHAEAVAESSPPIVTWELAGLARRAPKQSFDKAHVLAEAPLLAELSIGGLHLLVYEPASAPGKPG